MYNKEEYQELFNDINKMKRKKKNKKKLIQMYKELKLYSDLKSNYLMNNTNENLEKYLKFLNDRKNNLTIEEKHNSGSKYLDLYYNKLNTNIYKQKNNNNNNNYYIIINNIGKANNINSIINEYQNIIDKFKEHTKAPFKSAQPLTLSKSPA